MRRARITLLVVVAALSAMPAWAQEQPADTLIPTLKTKASVSEEERRQLNAWIAQRVATVAAAQPEHDTMRDAQKALREMREAVASANRGFIEVYVAAYADALREKHSSATLSGAGMMMSLLASFNEATTAPILRDALRDERTAVRAAAAIGLRRLRQKIATVGGDAFSQTIGALRDAGKRETAGTVLQTIYQALDYAQVAPNPPDPRAIAAALLDVLETRAALMDGNAAAAEGADLAGVEAMDRMRRGLTDDEKRRYTLILGKLLRHCVVRYHGELYRVKDAASNSTQVSLRNATELMVQQIEKQLGELLPSDTKPRPSIFEAMSKMNKEGDRGFLKVRMNDWADLLEKATGQRFHITVEESGGG